MTIEITWDLGTYTYNVNPTLNREILIIDFTSENVDIFFLSGENRIMTKLW